MSPLAGRFLGRDPIRYSGGLNLTNFLVTTLLRSTDPTGLRCNEDTNGDTDCEEKTEQGNCGAEISSAFSQYLALITPSLKNLPADQVGVWDGLWWMWRNGGNIDFWVRGGQPECCATKQCSNSIMLCGNCVRDTVTNNILFGFVAAAHGIAEGDAALGANINNVGRGNGLEGCEQHHAYSIGYRLWDHYSTSGALFTEHNMCSIINGSSIDPFGWFPLINCIKEPFEGCSSCGESLTLGQVGRRGIGDTKTLPFDLDY